MPARQHIRSLFLLAIAVVLATGGLRGQPPVASVPDQLVRIPGGFLGIVQEGALTRLGRYDRALRQLSSSAVFGLRPVVMSISTSPAGVHGLLLARPLGNAALFRIPLDGPPEPHPLWRGDGTVLDRIVTAGELDSLAGPDALLAGDSAVVLIGADGRERYRLRGAILAAHVVERHLVLVTADAPSTIILSLHSLHDGVAFTSRAIPWIRAPLVSVVGTDQKRLVIASTTGRRQVTIVDPRPGLGLIRRTIDVTPFAFVPYGPAQIAALSRDFPRPELVILGSDLRRVQVDYPLRAVFETVATGASLNALVSSDSAAVYDLEWRLLRVVPVPGATRSALIETGPDAAMLSSAEGTVSFTVDRTERPWIARYWPWLLAGLAGLLVLALVATFLRRYAEIRSIYHNLVDVPSSTGVIVLSRTQRVRRMNGSAQALLGISSYIPLGRHLSEYLNREEHRPAMADARRLFSTGESFERRADLPGEAGPRALTFRGRTLLSRAGFRAGYLLLVEDVTRTIEQERLVNWASVAHHIAHEMKTPLGTVRMTAEMLRDRLGTNGRDEEFQRATGRILKQSERLREIVEDLLTVARTESLQKVRADVGLLLTSLVHEYVELMPPSADLRLVITGEDHRATADVQQLTVALRNLLDNARHAVGAREGGRVAVTLAREERLLRIVVEDNGIGMRAETLAKLFQPFYSEREGGSGIGTVIIKRVFEAHGGSVNVVSTPGVGTRFTLELPRE